MSAREAEKTCRRHFVDLLADFFESTACLFEKGITIYKKEVIVIY